MNRSRFKDHCPNSTFVWSHLQPTRGWTLRVHFKCRMCCQAAFIEPPCWLGWYYACRPEYFLAQDWQLFYTYVLTNFWCKGFNSSCENEQQDEEYEVHRCAVYIKLVCLGRTWEIEPCGECSDIKDKTVNLYSNEK